MKRILLLACSPLALTALGGCAGLSINFDAAITYRSDVPLAGRTGK